MPYCPKCGIPVMGNQCQRCDWSGENQQPTEQQPAQQQPEQHQTGQQQTEQQRTEQQKAVPQKTEQKRKSNSPIIFAIIIIAAIMIIGTLYFVIFSPEDNSITPPVGAFQFEESSQVVGNYTGSIISLSDETLLSECSVTIFDSSTSLSASDGPPLSENTIQTGSGLSCRYRAYKANSKIDAGDVWYVTGGATGDQIKLIYKTGDLIALYTLN